MTADSYENAVWPYAQQWSFGIQRSIPGNILTTISYVGSRGTHASHWSGTSTSCTHYLERESVFGPNEPLTLADCTVTPTSFPPSEAPGNGVVPFLLQNGTLVSPQSPAYVHLQAACASPNIPNVNSAALPYQGLGQALSLENVAVSTYHALQATMRRTSGPLTLGVSYSYSHSIDNSSDRSDPVLVDSVQSQLEIAQIRILMNVILLNVNYIYNLTQLRQALPNVDHWPCRRPEGGLTRHGRKSSPGYASAHGRLGNWKE